MRVIMKRFAIPAVALALWLPSVANAESVEIDGKTYKINRLIERQIAPGTTYMRLQLPEIPVNINMVVADMDNEYVRVENSPAKGSSKGVELISAAAQRLSTEGHKVVAGQNANFWAVSSQAPDGKMFGNVTRNASIRNGMIVTECNMGKEKAFGGPEDFTGIMGISPDKDIFLDFCTPSVGIRINDRIAIYSVAQCNKGVHPDEIGMYNRFYGQSKEFVPISAEYGDGGFYQAAPAGDALEVILDLEEGESWMGGRFINFVVKEVRDNGGKGTLGDHDLALVARGAGKAKMGTVNVGDKVALKYAFKFNPSGAPEYPLVETAIGGNLLMMLNGEVLGICGNSSYDYNTYARSLYGTSADRRKLYMMVVDKSTDPVYGKSAGLSTARAAQIARHFGCTDMLQCDGGGSAQLYVGSKVVNKTTESTPRAVANCLLVFDEAPADDATAELRVDIPGDVINLEPGQSISPVLLVYNQYGSLIHTFSYGYTMTCSDGLGTVDGNTFTASSVPVAGTITIKYDGKEVTRVVSVGGAETGVTTIGMDMPANGICYNLLGVPCGENPAPGIYIRDGKKIVIGR